MSKDIDIIEFTENYCGIKLLDCQKNMLRELISIDKNVTLVYPRWNGYSCYRHLSESVKGYFNNGGKAL